MLQTQIERRIEIEERCSILFAQKEGVESKNWPTSTAGDKIAVTPKFALENLELSLEERNELEAALEEYRILSNKIHKAKGGRADVEILILETVKMNSMIDDFRKDRRFQKFGTGRRKVDSCLFNFVRDELYSSNTRSFEANLRRIEVFVSKTEVENLKELFNRYFKMSKEMHFNISNIK